MFGARSRITGAAAAAETYTR